MPFPKNVRDEALVLAARHCCVCHRYKGLKIEVHHIVHESKGGPNTLKNAIVLCFDCHTDAGHYNPQHPKGTKFSPSELRLARNRWHKIVKREAIPIAKSTGFLNIRYFVCKDFEAIKEIADGNLGNFPVAHCFLAPSPVSKFVSEIVSKVANGYRIARLWGESFDSEEVYVAAHPDALRTRNDVAAGQKWLEYERAPDIAEVADKVAPNDFISDQMVKSKISSGEICSVRAYTDGCGSVLLQEEYCLRPFWVAYMVISNISENRIRLLEWTAKEIVDTGHSIRHVDGQTPTVEFKKSFPPAEIPPKSSVIVPVASILGPLSIASEETTWTEGCEVAVAQVQQVSHSRLSRHDSQRCLFWGPMFRPSTISLVHDGDVHHEEVHELDLENMYVISRYWQMGSCPHIFTIDRFGTVRYLGEILVGEPAIPRISTITIDQSVVTVVLAELEDEQTHISSISQGESKIAADIVLNKGEFITIAPSGTEPIVIAGRYELPHTIPPHARKDFERVRSIVKDFSSYLKNSSKRHVIPQNESAIRLVRVS